MPHDSSQKLIEIAIALSAEKDIDVLFALILREAMTIANCDGGTVYVKEHDCLRFHTSFTNSKGGSLNGGNVKGIPPVPLDHEHVSSCCALEARLINIGDVYATEEYDFSGTRQYDERNDYRTVSMLVVPMKDDHDEVIGVLQLINAMNEAGEIVPFDPACVQVISALAALAAIRLNNRRLAQEVSDILHSFVAVMVEAVDTRSPYNANHTRSMARYAARFLDWMEETDCPRKLAGKKREPFLMSVWLHDIGKLVVPLEIMDKQTRLGPLEERILNRVQIAILMERIRGLEDPQVKAEADQRIEELNLAIRRIREANRAGFLDDDMVETLRRSAQIVCLTAEGQEIPLLAPKELEAITVRRGTLTDAERHQMELHVTYTAQMLHKMQFHGDYESVPAWASAHHEQLDGSGYPDHLRAESLPDEVRILTILDIYDALTAEDRPYKPPMPVEKAFAVLRDMAEHGKLDGELLDYFVESGAWKKD